MRKILVFMFLLLIILQSTCLATPFSSSLNAQKDTFTHVGVLNDVQNPIRINDDLSLTTKTIYTGESQIAKENIPDYYCRKERDMWGASSYYATTLQGARVSIENSSDKIYVIKWSESVMQFGTFSGIPYIADMKFIDAGDKNKTPDTVITPHTTATLSIYTNNVEFSKFDSDWHINGEPVPINNSIGIKLFLKIYDENNTSKFYPLQLTHLGWIDK